jgi:WD40 repeat protein
MVADARRFVVENFDLIDNYCLETYHSALVWVPLQSVIRKHYVTQKPGLPKVILGLRKAWGSCERTVICRRIIESVAFSSDGRHIVSGSGCGTVQIWNAATGLSEGNFEGHSGAMYSVAFSRDGSHIVSGSNDKTIRIWNVATGVLEGVFEGHSGSVRSVDFSNDRIRIVSGSDSVGKVGGKPHD